MDKHMQGKIENQAQLNNVTNIISSLQGQICWRFTRSYGGAYHFDFGRKIKFGNHFMGEWYLNTHGTNFILKDEDTILIDTNLLDLDDPSTINKLKDLLNILLGKKVTLFSIDYDSLSLTINFDNSLYLIILPLLDDEQYEEPYWSIRFPNTMVLSISKGRYFSYKSL